jgi:hypothetical protein
MENVIEDLKQTSKGLPRVEASDTSISQTSMSLRGFLISLPQNYLSWIHSQLSALWKLFHDSTRGHSYPNIDWKFEHINCISSLQAFHLAPVGSITKVDILSILEITRLHMWHLCKQFWMMGWCRSRWMNSVFVDKRRFHKLATDWGEFGLAPVMRLVHG